MTSADNLRHAALVLDQVRVALAGGSAGERRALLAAFEELRDSFGQLEAIVQATDRPPRHLLVGPVEPPPARPREQPRQVDPPLRVAAAPEHAAQLGKHVHVPRGGR